MFLFAHAFKGLQIQVLNQDLVAQALLQPRGPTLFRKLQNEQSFLNCPLCLFCVPRQLTWIYGYGEEVMW